MTRFLVLGRQQAEPTGRDKTSLLLVTRDEPGILYRMLGALRRARAQHDQDREPPVAPAPWEYVFFVDIDGHQRDAAVAAALAEVAQSCETLKVLGVLSTREKRRAAAPADAAARNAVKDQRMRRPTRSRGFPERCCGLRNRAPLKGVSDATDDRL